jgi:hypothetical protein
MIEDLLEDLCRTSPHESPMSSRIAAVPAPGARFLSWWQNVVVHVGSQRIV